MVTKQRKHPFITEALNKNCDTLTVWPSEGEAMKAFTSKLDKIRNDPRILKEDSLDDNHYRFTIKVEE